MQFKALFLSGLMLVAIPAQAGDASAGKAISEACATCHGDTGKDDPPIAGMPEPAMIKAIKEYQAGVRNHKKMTKAVKDLSETDIANVAAYYSSLK